MRWLAVVLLCSCAATSHETSATFSRAYTDAVEAQDVELPALVRTSGDVRLIAKAREALVACAAGKSTRFSDAWLRQHRDELIAVDGKTRSIGALAKDCASMLEAFEQREVRACGARYVRLERWKGGSRVTQTSEGWYMTPCSETKTAKKLGKDAEVARAACQSADAGVYLVTPWSRTATGETATAACIVPAASRHDWLPGNPGLGIK